jgi:drug/metabolite transporter (DMT)-like permease
MTGEALALVTAFIFAGAAAQYGSASRRGYAGIPLVAVASLTATTVSLVLLVRWDAWQQETHLLPLSVCMCVAGMAGQSGMVMVSHAMSRAPSRMAATWTIFQMIMLAPFLWAVFGWGQSAAFLQWAALVPIGASLYLLQPSRTGPGGAEQEPVGPWLRALGCAYLLGALGQTLMQEPSLRGWDDPMRLRVPLALGGGAVLLWTLAVFRRTRPRPKQALRGIGIGLTSCAGNFIVFLALDAATKTGRTFIVFPTAVGGSVLLYAAFQFATRREPFTPYKAAGIALGITGLVMLGLRF